LGHSNLGLGRLRVLDSPVQRTVRPHREEVGGGWRKLYEGASKIFRTGAVIYTAVVVARSTGRV
jgi:hypothetical protein